MNVRKTSLCSSLWLYDVSLGLNRMLLSARPLASCVYNTRRYYILASLCLLTVARMPFVFVFSRALKVSSGGELVQTEKQTWMDEGK